MANVNLKHICGPIQLLSELRKKTIVTYVSLRKFSLNGRSNNTIEAREYGYIFLRSRAAGYSLNVESGQLMLEKHD